MTHDSLSSRLVLSALPLIAACVFACGSGSESDVPSFGGDPSGTPGTGTDPNAPNQPGPNGSDPTQPGGTPTNPGEMPVSNGQTPLNPGETPDGTVTTPPGGEPPATPATNPPPRSDGVTGTQNLFVDVLGRTQGEVDQKLQTAVNAFFGLAGNDPTTPTLQGGARSFYTLPQDASMGFVYAADSSDIRSEGMSYGMFIAVQMGMQTQFDQLWRFAKTYMQQSGEGDLSGWRHYFRWTGTVNTANATNWQVNYNATEPPASDGEEYFAAALYLADRRWGSAGEINYEAEADTLADAMLNNIEQSSRFPLFHAEENMVVFVPYGTSNEHSDPSYHLPAFYRIFAEDGPAEDAARWLAIAEVSRDYLVRSANAQTGLHPDYANFDGTPTQGYQASEHDQFQFDAWRVPMNMAIDYAWTAPDARMAAQVEKYHAFFGTRIANGTVQGSLFNLDGSNSRGGGSQALVATLASGALATNNGSRMLFVNTLWNAPQPTGQYRYYQGSVYLLGLLATAGRFSFAFPE